MRKPLVCLCLILGALVPLHSQAEDIAAEALVLCEKVKACAMAEIAEEDLTPELRQMMQPMLDNMCTNMQSKVQDVATDHALYEPAVACMRSMSALSCQQMQTEQVNTPACQAYEELTRETYGAD